VFLLLLLSLVESFPGARPWGICVNRSVLAPASLLDSCGSELERRSGRLQRLLPAVEREVGDAASSPEAARDELSATARPTTARLKGWSSGRNVWAEGDRTRVSPPHRCDCGCSRLLAAEAAAMATRAVQVESGRLGSGRVRAPLRTVRGRLWLGARIR